MQRHEAKPGRTIVGLVAIGTAVLYAGDTAGTWRTEWYTALPLLFGGLVLAAVVGLAVHSARRRHPRPEPDRSESKDSTGDPTSTRGSQAIK
ncbi:hypothetical protein [Streptomyces sp. 8L]|uniref:hypothetical protein n=1 Tax=Streptomyces sp. 8L TaxID=2877242 RepID=UPI001CD1B57D|nr:hypothetical protein [Streptomyces sp. 8L]MCA1219054.1 hypothetical protein [Streptomyces sp. 8L]